MTRPIPKNMNAKQPEVKAHYFLVAGNVFFTTAEAPEEPVSLPMNGIISNFSGQLPTSMLGRGQQALAQACADKVGPEVGMNLVDVQLTSISKLGHMLPSEFHDVKFQPAPTAEDHAPAKVE